MAIPRPPPLAQVTYALSSTALRSAGSPDVADLLSSFLDVSPLIPPARAAASGSVRLFERVISRVFCADVDRVLHAFAFSQALEAAITANDLVMVETIHELRPEPLAVSSLEFAIAHGSFDLVQWIVEHRHDRLCCSTGIQQLCPECVKVATKSVGDKDAFRIGKWLLENDLISISNGSCAGFVFHATGGLSQTAQDFLVQSVDLARWWDEQGLLTEPMIDKIVCESLEWPKDESAQIVSYFVERGYVPLDPGRYVNVLIKAATRRGLEDLIESALKAVPEPTRRHFTYAPIHEGGVKVFQWSREFQEERGYRGMTMINVYAQHAVEIDKLEWFYDERCRDVMPNKIHAESETDALQVVKWLHRRKNGSRHFSPATLDNVAGSGHLRVVQWLHKHRHEGCTPTAIDNAATNGHLDVVQWLHKHQQVGFSDRAIEGAAREGHLAIVRWLYVNGDGHNLSAPMAFATVKGHLDIVRWCLEQHNACVRCVYTQVLEQPTMFRSPSGGPPHPRVVYVLEWLHTHKDTKVIGCEGACAQGYNTFPSGNLATHALTSGHFQLLEFLYEHHRDLFTSHRGVGGAAIFAIGHVSVMQWLFEHFSDAFDWLRVAEHAESVKQTKVATLLRELIATRDGSSWNVV